MITEDLVWHVRPNTEYYRHPPCVSLDKDAGQETWERKCLSGQKQTEYFDQLCPILETGSVKLVCGFRLIWPLCGYTGHCKSKHLLSWWRLYCVINISRKLTLIPNRKGALTGQIPADWYQSHKTAGRVLTLWTFFGTRVLNTWCKILRKSPLNLFKWSS